MVRSEENKVRKHFLQRIQDVKMTPFPSSSSGTHCRKPLARTSTIHVYCTCRLPDNGGKIICCDKCLEWFHFRCLGLQNSDLVIFCQSSLFIKMYWTIAGAYPEGSLGWFFWVGDPF